MENITIDAGVGTYPASAFSRVAITDLEVFERAVTQRGAWGELCPQGDWAGARSQSSSDQRANQRPDSGTTSIAMGNVRIFKPRTWSYATSSTG